MQLRGEEAGGRSQVMGERKDMVRRGAFQGASGLVIHSGFMGPHMACRGEGVEGIVGTRCVGVNGANVPPWHPQPNSHNPQVRWLLRSPSGEMKAMFK